MAGTALPDPDRPSTGGTGLPNPDRPTVDGDGPSVEEWWGRIQQAVRQLHEDFLASHAIAEEAGSNPILLSRSKVQENLSVTSLYVEEYREDIPTEDLSVFEWAVRQIGDFCRMTGDTAWLGATAHAWQEDIAKPLSGHVPWFTLDYMATDNSWSGPAAKAYKDHLRPQKNAMDAVKSVSLQLATALETVAKDVKKFWADLVMALAKAAADLVAEVVGWFGTDVVLNPGQKVGGVIRVLADAIEKVARSFREASREFTDAIDELRKTVINQAAFPVEADGGSGGRWPRPGVHLTTDRDDWIPGPVG